MLWNRVWVFVLAIAVVAYFVRINLYALQRDDTSPLATNSFVDNLKSLQSPPSAIYSAESSRSYAFGRYYGPIPNLNFAPTTTYQNIFHRKKWHFVAVSSGDTLIGLAIADMGYLTSGFVYYLNTTTDATEFQQVVMPKLPFSSPLGDITVAETTVPSTSQQLSSCSRFTGGLLSSLAISICATSVNAVINYDVVVNAVFSNFSFVLNTTITSIASKTTSLPSPAGCEHFAMLYPLGVHRPAYTNKLANCGTTGYVTTSNASIPVTSALMDYTNGMPSHLTTWYWIAITTPEWGLQMSTGVYSDKEGNGMENIFWWRGNRHVLNCSVNIASGAHKNPPPGSGAVILGRGVEVVCSDATVQIDLVYLPMAQVPTTVNTPVLSGSLLHTYGIYNGEIEVKNDIIEVKRIPGILEDHFAYW